jgi:mono/diheme cytochrome c family protein
VTSRLRMALIVGTLALAGCDDSQWTGPILYRDSERFAKDLADKPKLQETIHKALIVHFGEDLRHIKVPEDSGLRENGRYLANFVRTGEKRDRVLVEDPATGKEVAIEGGYALYRKNCLHCHGVFGAGDGPTGQLMYPRPRDFRPGIYKFTSTNPVNAKPTRADLRKTILYGLQGTSMPGFEALMSATEIEQVIDYMTFLSMRGETERYLIDEAMNSDDKDAESALPEDLVKEVITKVTTSWKEAETQVVNPSARRVAPSPESVTRGRDLYLGSNPAAPKLECAGCHGASGKGNGGSFIEPEIFRDVALRFYPLDQAIDRYYRVEKDKAAAHPQTPSKAAIDAVATFLGESPTAVAFLRKDHRLLSSLSDPDFDAKLKTDRPAVAAEARRLLPDLDDPDFRGFLLAKLDPTVVGKFLEENPLVVTQLRKNRGLMAEVAEKDFAEKFKSDLPAIVTDALKILPDLNYPVFRALLVSKMDLWTKSLDAWDNPLRPANLIEGSYKGGRRPLDLYWRIAKGINGVKMPAHAGLLTDEQIWDVVNFVLALPEDPDLLPESAPVPAKAHAVATSH